MITPSVTTGRTHDRSKRLQDAYLIWATALKLPAMTMHSTSSWPKSIGILWNSEFRLEYVRQHYPLKRKYQLYEHNLVICFQWIRTKYTNQNILYHKLAKSDLREHLHTEHPTVISTRHCSCITIAFGFYPIRAVHSIFVLYASCVSIETRPHASLRNCLLNWLANHMLNNAR